VGNYFSVEVDIGFSHSGNVFEFHD
jgi:hypothetical protein